MDFLQDTAQRLGTTIREERHRQRLDQRTLALVANVGVRTVHRIENGEPTVRFDVVVKVLSALGLELDTRRRSEP